MRRSHACALEPGRRFVTERGKKKKKKESRNFNPGLTAWVKRKKTKRKKVCVESGKKIGEKDSRIEGKG